MNIVDINSIQPLALPVDDYIPVALFPSRKLLELDLFVAIERVLKDTVKRKRVYSAQVK